jgi:hypothetical protein
LPQAFDPIDLQVGLLITENLHEFEKIRGAGHRMALKKIALRQCHPAPE